MRISRSIINITDKTTLVDVNTAQTEKALSGLPAKALGRVSLVKAEVSGAVGALRRALTAASQEAEYGRFLAAATAKVNGLDVMRSQAELGGPYAFVCSQLLMTQLSAIPYRHLSNLVKEKYGRALSLQPGGADEALIDALNELNLRMEIGHLAHLDRLSKRNGAIHFADTMAEMRGAHLLPMVLLPVFSELANRFHNLRGVHQWQWQASPRLAFYVRSYALASKRK